MFAIIGRLAGWARPSVFYACDAALLIGFCGLVIGWSRVRFGKALPGVVGSLQFLGYYLSLDYCHVAQRDWHGPAFACASLLVAQCGSNRTIRIVSGLAAAIALTIRPQTVLFFPAILAAVFEGSPSDAKNGNRLFEWFGSVMLGLAIGFAPIVAYHLLDDFLRSIRLASYGGFYNQVTPTSLWKNWLAQAISWKWWSVAGGILLLGAPFKTTACRTAIPWLLSLLCVSMYKPISPMAHSYLDIPMILVWSVAVACLVGLMLEPRPIGAEWRLCGILLTLGLGTSTLRPEFCRAGPAASAVASWFGATPSEAAPPGYRHGTVPTSAYYDWKDYKNALDYLKHSTKPGTPVGNVLMGDPAVSGMVDRPALFPAESMAWLWLVQPDDEPRFAEALERVGDSVIIWIPGEVGPDPNFTVEKLIKGVRRHYHPEAKFGVIEIWRRNAE